MAEQTYEERRKLLLSEILQASEARKLKWTEDAEAMSFSTVLAGKYVVRSSNRDNDRYLTVFNDQDTQLFKFIEKSNQPVGDVYRIYELARRSALQLEEALGDMLSELERL